jgi:molecular chaperone GrpE
MKIHIGKQNGTAEHESPENEKTEGPSALESTVAELESALAQANEQTLRRTAELENMRRRFQQERELLIYEANKRLLTDLLGNVDDIERTLEHARKQEAASLIEGVELVYRNLVKLLERYGVTAMETVGQPFDVHLHDALMEETRTDMAPGTITTEVQRGYLLRDTVLRHAKVIVAKAPETTETE